MSPNFIWAKNALSDLGHWTRTDIGPNPFVRAFIFNFGLTTTGILLVFITLVFMKALDDIPTIVAMIPFLLASGFLTSIGIFSEDTGIIVGGESLHYIVSVGFFVTFPFAMLFIGLSWLRFPNLRWISCISLLLPFTSVYIWWGTFRGIFPWTGMAIPELATALTAIAWFWLFLRLEAQNVHDQVEK